MENDILSQLNDSQRRAVEYCDGPALVIAGAGSGKTRVLTYKIAYLLQQGYKPWNIMALTFTNKAAKEMKTRIGKLVGDDLARYLNMGTFHSIFARILRREAASLGYQPSFTIYDEGDSRSLIKDVIKNLGLDDKQYKPATVHSRISMAKNHLITPEQYVNDRSALQRDVETRLPHITDIYSQYQLRLLQANAMDFDDLLVNTFLLFKRNEDIRIKYADAFKYILVDEYQDTNMAQQAIVLQLAKEHKHVCVVGDDAQSIYAFRGANIDNILDFRQQFKEAELFKLEQNYRSTQRIVEAANSLIKHNQRQIQKDVFSMNQEGEKINYKPAYSDKEEAVIVCNDISSIRRKDKCDYSDFAILYRTNAQSRAFEEELRRRSIPYRIYGGLSFYQRKEIKDILAYFRLTANPHDEEALKRVINYPTRGIGNTTIQKIQECALNNNVSLWEVIECPEKFSLGINKGTLTKVGAFRDLICGYIADLEHKDALVLGQEIIQSSGISAQIYSSKDPEDIAKQENVQELVASLQEFVEIAKEEGREKEVYLDNFIHEIALFSDLDSEDDESGKVSLMTIHSAKGLEFPTVFIVGLEENIFPSQMATNSMKELEEERRLLYVAITRAEKHCILTNAKSRFRYGRMEFDSPSRFLNDIDPTLIQTDTKNAMGGAIDRPFGFARTRFNPQREMQNSRPVATQFRADPKPKITSPRRKETAIDPLSAAFKNKIAESGGNLKKVEDAIKNGGRTLSSTNQFATATLKVGDIIEHQRFGIGEIIKIEGNGENTKATVAFKNAGTKQLLLKFAKYKILS